MKEKPLPEPSEELAQAAEAWADFYRRTGETYWENVWIEEARKIREEIKQRLYEQLKGLYG